MSAPDRTGQPALDRPPAEGGVAAPIDRGGVYLTNEVFLYRVVGLAGDGPGEVVELEDCYRLDVVRVSLGELHASGLRVVTPAPAAG